MLTGLKFQTKISCRSTVFLLGEQQVTFFKWHSSIIQEKAFWNSKVICFEYKFKAKLLLLANTRTPAPTFSRISHEVTFTVGRLVLPWDIYPSNITFMRRDNKVLFSTGRRVVFFFLKYIVSIVQENTTENKETKKFLFTNSFR